MLANQTYLGKVFLKAYKEEPARSLSATHQAIIDDATFIRVHNVLAGKRKPYKQPKDDIQNALPLRGHFICPECGRVLTGSTPKGNGGKYPYYHCQQTKYGCKFRFSAKNAHAAMADYLKTFQPSQEVINLFTNVLANIFDTNDADRLIGKQALEEKIAVVDQRLIKIENDYADGILPTIHFNKFSKRFEDEKNELVMQHATFATKPPEFDRYISYSCGLVQNLSNYYTSAEPSTQNKLVGLIFPQKLVFTGKEYKTENINPVFDLISNIGKGFKENSPAKIARLYGEAPPSGLEPETL